MSDVTRPCLIESVTFFSAWNVPYHRHRSRVSMLAPGGALPAPGGVSAPPSAEDAIDVLVGLPAAGRLGEDHVVGVDLDDLAVPQEHGAIREPPCLVDEVGDQEDRHLAPQLLHHVLDAHGGHGIDRD